jgi:hypothetical protein
LWQSITELRQLQIQQFSALDSALAFGFRLTVPAVFLKLWFWHRWLWRFLQLEDSINPLNHRYLSAKCVHRIEH